MGSIRVRQGDWIRKGYIWGEADHLESLCEAQRTYIVQCYVKEKAPTSHTTLPARMCDMLRRIAVIAKQRHEAIPTLPGILVPAASWRYGVGCVLIRIKKGEAAHLPIHLEEMPPDPSKVLWIEEETL